MYSIYIQCVSEGGGEVNCAVDHILQEILHSVTDQIQNLPNCYTTPNKMTSEDDIEGLESLKFLRPCFESSLGCVVQVREPADGSRCPA